MEYHAYWKKLMPKPMTADEILSADYVASEMFRRFLDKS